MLFWHGEHGWEVIENFGGCSKTGWDWTMEVGGGILYSPVGDGFEGRPCSISAGAQPTGVRAPEHKGVGGGQRRLDLEPEPLGG